MKTIINNTINEIEIKNSRFITLLFKFTDNDDLDKYLSISKNKYPKATHYTYVYITESYKKSSDDGEPGGTAGLPMLNVLEKENIINCLAITVRYFGGIKLGAGGLVRAYSKSVRESITDDNLVELEEGYLVKITISYDQQKDLEYKLNNYTITNKEYLDNVIYSVLLPVDKIDILNNYNYEIINKTLINKTAI